jgi:hypothetical protein
MGQAADPSDREDGRGPRLKEGETVITFTKDHTNDKLRTLHCWELHCEAELNGKPIAEGLTIVTGTINSWGVVDYYNKVPV